jgi:lipid II:glycine glycyltransferase (peptidoglycan interpeptide bridge formation enzyme)
MVVFFNSNQVWHSQYIASTPYGRKNSSLDAIFSVAMSMAREEGALYFDFGISTEQNGALLNSGLYTFKSEFGAGGCTYDQYEVSL